MPGLLRTGGMAAAASVGGRGCGARHPPRCAPAALQNNKAEYQVQACSQDEVDACFKAAKEAGPGWAKTPLWKRAEYMHKVATALKENWEVRLVPHASRLPPRLHHACVAVLFCRGRKCRSCFA